MFLVWYLFLSFENFLNNNVYQYQSRMLCIRCFRFTVHALTLIRIRIDFRTLIRICGIFGRFILWPGTLLGARNGPTACTIVGIHFTVLRIQNDPNLASLLYVPCSSPIFAPAAEGLRQSIYPIASLGTGPTKFETRYWWGYLNAENWKKATCCHRWLFSQSLIVISIRH